MATKRARALSVALTGCALAIGAVYGWSAEPLAKVSETAAPRLLPARPSPHAAARSAPGLYRAGSAAGARAAGSRVAAWAAAAGVAQERPYLDRSDCVTASFGSGVASECGDLRLVYGLPGTRTMNKMRAPALLYNSRHAYPHTIHAALVTNTTGAAWDSVSMMARRAGVVKASSRWPGWADAAARRLAVTFAENVSSTSPSAAVYSDTMVVSVKAGGVWTQHAVIPVNHIVVDRRGSPFGSGWWMAGLERLHFVNGDRILWVGGDGSARVYVPVAVGRWVSAQPDRPDTIVGEPIGLYNGAGETGYVRKLPGKGRVVFRATGTHLYTRNRLGHTTWFFHDASNRLTQVALPTAVTMDTTYSYWFGYNSAAGTLGEVVAPHVSSPGDRRVVLAAAGSPGAVRVTQITTFPFTSDSITTRYAYDALGRDTSVTHAGMMTRTRFAYGWSRLTVASTSALTNGHTDVVTVGIGPVEIKGLTSGVSTPATTLLYSSFDGPLPGKDPLVDMDYQSYFFDANGRVKWVDTPRRREQVFREDARFPALVTTTLSATGFKNTASYDARGRVASQTSWNPLGDGRNATTQYTWNDQWDELASMTSPTGITTTFGYDERGLRAWQQVGPDSTRRTRYGYNTRGQVDQVRSVAAAMRGEAAEVLGYDPLLGNLVSTRSPLGIESVTTNDRIGRPVRVVAPTDSLLTASGIAGPLFSVDSTVYDLAGRVRETFSWGEQQKYYSKMDGLWQNTRLARLRVRNGYDAAGRLERVERWSEPDSARVGVMLTRFEYDGFGRKTAEIAADGRRETHHYDLAGRDTLTVNRLGEPIRMRYDVRGQLLSRAMAGDSSSFTYNSQLGVMTGADNAHARIRRSYYPSGLLKGDTSWVAFENGTFVTGRHVYGMRYDYDLEGRRVAMTLPDSLRPSAAQGQIGYDYDATTGALTQITDPLGGAYTFQYRSDGALERTTAPGGVFQTHQYDADGRLRVRVRGDRAVSMLYSDTLRYDLRGRTVFARTLTGTSEMTYDGLGHLAHSLSNEWMNYSSPESEEEYFHDGVGNKVWHRRTSYAIKAANAAPVYPTVEYYAPGTARDTATVAAPGVYFAATAPPRQTVLRTFDRAGNLFQSVAVNPVKLAAGTMTVGGRVEPRTAYAEPDGITHGSESTSNDGQQQVITTYTYRPDGKLTQVNRSSTCIYSLAYSGGCTTQAPAYNEQTRAEAFRYDALGRRVWVKTVTLVTTAGNPNGGCVFRCDNTTRRTVWAGDHVLAEIRYPNGQGEQDTGLDSTNVAEQRHRDERGTTDAGHPYGGRNTSDWAQSGRVLYVHGGGMDQPLSILRMDYSYDLPAAVTIVPHASWRGTYETATFAGPVCTTVYVPYNEIVYQDASGKRVAWASVTDENGFERDTTQMRCVEVDFPGKYQGMTRLLRRQTASGPIAWMGSLMQDGQDASGLMFRRNRYYDASSGRFTQEDPIGLAGGLNSYGFANGDPVNYGDPYGLTADTLKFNGRTATLVDDQGNTRWTGAASSGQPGSRARDQNVKDFGPLPEGTYSLDPADISSVSGFPYLLRALSGLPKGHMWSDWGSNRVRLTPGAGTNTFGRSDFFVHGGNNPGSLGCIDVGAGEGALFALLKESKGPIPVVVEYANASVVTAPSKPLVSRLDLGLGAH